VKTPSLSRAFLLVSTAVAISTGLVVLLGYFLTLPFLINLRLLLLQWAVSLAAVALLFGVINLLSVHFTKIRAGDINAVYSLVLVAALLGTLGLGVILGPNHEFVRWIFNTVQVPVEASLLAILAISLAYASARLLHRRLQMFSVIFVGTALLIFLGTGSFPWGELPFISDVIRPWLAQVPAAAGARGILLGVSLGIIATGLRILTGADRPYGG